MRWLQFLLRFPLHPIAGFKRLTSGTYSLNLELSPAIWKRLHQYALQSVISEEEAALKILERYLPNLTGGLALAVERLAEHERELFRNSFYSIVYIVALADDDKSFLEGLSIEEGFRKLKDYFGSSLTRLMDLNQQERKTLLNRLQQTAVEDVIIYLAELREVLEKLPESFVEEYKLALLDSGLAVAQASREKLFGERISKVERQTLCCIMLMLGINIERHAGYFDPEWADLQRWHLWKMKQLEKNS